MSQQASREQVFRLAVFYIWVATLSVVVVVMVLVHEWRGLDFKEVQAGFSHLFEILTPQISIMAAYLFSGTKEDRSKMLKRDPGTVRAAVVLSCLYHGSLVYCLVFVVLLGSPMQTFGQNMEIVTAVAGYLSIFGVAPVGFLFASANNHESSAQH